MHVRDTGMIPTRCTAIYSNRLKLPMRKCLRHSSWSTVQPLCIYQEKARISGSQVCES